MRFFEPLLAATAALAAMLGGCAPYTVPPPSFRHWTYSRPLPAIPYSVHPIPAALLPPATTSFPAPPPPVPVQPAATGAALQPYSQEDLAAGIAEVTLGAWLLTGGTTTTPPLRGRGTGLPDFRLDGPDISEPDKPEPYNCAFGYASMGTCVAPLK